MPIERVNVYVGCSCPIMGTNRFGMHTINLHHGATSIIQLGCCMLQIVILLLHSHKEYKIVKTRGESSSQVTKYDTFLLWAIMKHHYILIDRSLKELHMRWKTRIRMCKSQLHRYHLSNFHVHVLWFHQTLKINHFGRWFKHRLIPSPSDASPSSKEHVLNVIKLNEIGPTHINLGDI
jgi:hypothetical protein